MKNLFVSELIFVKPDERQTQFCGGLVRRQSISLIIIIDLGMGESRIIKASIGADVALKTLDWDTETALRSQLWDIAGECKNEEASVVIVFKAKMQ